MAIRDSTQSGDTHGGGTLAFGTAVVDGDQLRITNAAHAININQTCTLGVSLCTTHQAMASGAAAGTGGSLPAGVYSIRIAAAGSTGTTSPSAPSSGVTISAGQVVRVTLPALAPGATSWNVYLSQAGGAFATERRYATGVAPGTFDCSSSLWENGTVAYASAADLPFGDALSYAKDVTSHTGAITVASGVVLTIKGDMSILGNFTQVAGTIEFDAGAAPANSYHSLYFGTVYAAGTPQLIQRGTSAAARAILRGKTGTTFPDLRVATQFFVNSSMRLDLEWALFQRLGSATRDTIQCVSTVTHNQRMRDVIFDSDCWAVDIQASSATAGWDLQRVSFRQTNGRVFTTPRKSCVRFTTTANKTTALRDVKFCSFEVLPPTIVGGGMVIEDCYMHDTWCSTVTSPLSETGVIRRQFIRKIQYDSPESGGNGTPASDNPYETEDVFLYMDWLTGAGSDFNNWGFGLAVADNVTRNYKRLTFEYNGPLGEGADALGMKGGNVGTIRITGCLVLPNAGQNTSGNIATFNNALSVDLDVAIEHNTYFGSNGGIMVSEGGASPAGMIVSLKSNLCYNLKGTAEIGISSRYMMAKTDMNGANDTFDIAAPANVSHNTAWNLSSIQGQWQGAYSWYNTRFSSQPGANDVNLGGAPNGDMSLVGPQFVDPTRNFQKWCETVLGATGTQTQKLNAGFNALKAIPDPAHANHVPGLVVTAPDTWIRAGWVPRSASLDPTNSQFWAHEGLGFTRGAIPHAGSIPPPPPPTGGDKLVMVTL